MTLALYQPIEPFTRAGWFALVRRHGDVTRLRAFIAGRARRVVDAGEATPTGNAVVRDVWGSCWRDHDGPSVPEAMATLGTIPWSDRARAEVFVMRTPSPPGWLPGCAEVGVPVDDDLDINGRCLCGCGYVAPRP